MSDNPILVTGATGSNGAVGRTIVKLLRDQNLNVRALVHRLDELSDALSNMGREVIVEDLTKGADVALALKGCKRIYFGMSLSPLYLQATVIAAARAKEIRDFEVFVNMPQLTVSQMSLTT